MPTNDYWDKTWDFWNNSTDDIAWNPKINLTLSLNGKRMENETIKIKCPECGKEHTVVIIVKEKEIIKKVPRYPYYRYPPYTPWYEKKDTGTDWTWRPHTTILTDNDSYSPNFVDEFGNPIRMYIS